MILNPKYKQLITYKKLWNKWNIYIFIYLYSCVIDIESEKVNENHISKDDTLDVNKGSMDSEINGYAANGTIKINVPVSKENSEILNGRNSSSNSFCDFRDLSPKNNISSSIVSNKKFQIKDFPQLYVECDPVSIFKI